jgi:hypothetical protein
MELTLNDIDCIDVLTPIKVLNPFLDLNVSKNEAINLINTPNNLSTFEWYSPERKHYIIGMILDCRTKQYLDLIKERCDHFNLNYDVKYRYFAFINNGLMNDEIHNAVYNKDIMKVIKLRIFKILKIKEK